MLTFENLIWLRKKAKKEAKKIWQHFDILLMSSSGPADKKIKFCSFCFLFFFFRCTKLKFLFQLQKSFALQLATQNSEKKKKILKISRIFFARFVALSKKKKKKNKKKNEKYYKLLNMFLCATYLNSHVFFLPYFATFCGIKTTNNQR